ncbi:hypothetical protein WDW89_01000 [Deltaproteobacteria bacterium TL4]
MPRIHAFEFCDHEKCPVFLRDSLVESLGNTFRWGKIYDAIAPVFIEFCQQADCDTILDLGSGSGEPVSILIDVLKKQQLSPPHFTISDLLPKVHAMEAVAARYPGQIEVISESLDATDVPERFDQSARTIISAFHHFPPELASKILFDCVRKQRAIFILEPFPRDLLSLAPLMLPNLAALLINPLLTHKDRILKMIFTYAFLTPLVIGSWDGVISVLRMYTEDELLDMVKPFGETYHWEYHKVPIALGGAITAFWGVHKQD